MKKLLLLIILLPMFIFAQHNITIDGDFSDWQDVPVSVTDPADDVHHTDGYPAGTAPGYRAYSDVDILKVKFTNDAENLFGYMSATGIIGNTSSDTLGHSKKGRYYFIFTIDVDENEDTGYRLNEGGYYPDSDGYDVNMEVEFYNGGFNTGHYINHEFLSDNAVETQGMQDLKDGIIRLAPGVYDYYSQWVTFEDSSYVVVADKGPVYQGIITIAVSEDGHEAEMKAPMWGFLKTPEGTPIIDLGYTLKVSASLEGSGELSEESINNGYTPGSHSEWGSDTAEPFLYTVMDPATSIADNSKNTVPQSTVLHPNYPNPFNPETIIEYELTENGFTSIVVYNILGKEIKSLVSENQAPGLHRISWDGKDNSGSNVGSGFYFIQLQTGNTVQSQKAILIR